MKIVWIITYIFGIVFAYYETRKYYSSKKRIFSADFSDFIVMLTPILNIILPLSRQFVDKDINMHLMERFYKIR
jgi:hypothetical protein